MTNLHSAILKVMEEVHGVKKAGKITSGGNYKYAKAEDVLAKIRPAMLDNDLTMCPVATDVVVNEVYKTSSGSSMNRIVVKRTYRITHAPTGEFLDIQVLGEGADVGDKACNKALTGAGKYARREAFQLEFGEDDPDKTPSSEQARASKTKPTEPEDDEPQAEAKTAAAGKKSTFERAQEAIADCKSFKESLSTAGNVFQACNEGRLKSAEGQKLIPLAIDKCLHFAKDFAHAAQIQTLVADAKTDKLLNEEKHKVYAATADNLAKEFSGG